MNLASLSTSDWQGRAARARYETRHFIDGKFVDSVKKGRFSVVNPASGAVLCEVSAGAKEDIDLAVASARKSFYSRVWSRKAPRERGAGADLAPALLWFRHYLSARIPALALERPPSSP